MAIMEQGYFESRTKRFQRRQRLVVFVSVVSIVASGVLSSVQFLRDAFQQGNPNSKAVQVSPLQAEERGYELVLQREAENQVALDGLFKVRLEMGNAQGAIEPLEKLAKLYPERQDYKAVLEAVKQKLGTAH